MSVVIKSLWIAGGLATGTVIGMAQMSAKFMDTMHVSMQRMDRDMAAAPMTGDVDRDFANMMIPHHQGAIEMAKAELRYGKDPVLLRLAQEIIVDQQSEIEAMQLRLSKPASTRKEKK